MKSLLAFVFIGLFMAVGACAGTDYVYHVKGDWATQIAKCDMLCATPPGVTPGYWLERRVDSDIATCTCMGLQEEQILRDRGFYD